MNNLRIFVEVGENCACDLIGIHPLQVPRGIIPNTKVTCLAELGGGVIEILWAIASHNTSFGGMAQYGAEKILQEIMNVSLPNRTD